MKKLKHVKLFENFNNFEPELKQTLIKILSMYKNELYGSREHPSEYWGDGESLRVLADKANDEGIDEGIIDILDKMADYSLAEDEGDAENIFDYLQDWDYNYIADFLGLPRLEDQEDEDTWSE
jgi:hypothetical protein